ncbi:MAG: hypothetical protein ABMB14_29020 [Myxococcota bacterium]
MNRRGRFVAVAVGLVAASSLGCDNMSYLWTCHTAAELRIDGTPTRITGYGRRYFHLAAKPAAMDDCRAKVAEASCAGCKIEVVSECAIERCDELPPPLF